MNRRLGVVTATLLSFFVLAGALAGPGSATAPGKNGRLLVTVSHDEGFSSRATMGPTGGGVTELEMGQVFGYGPTWAADGKAVISSGRGPDGLGGSTEGVYSAPVAGGDPELLWDLSATSSYVSGPAIQSPDGRFLAMSHFEVEYPRDGPERWASENGIYVKATSPGAGPPGRLDLGELGSPRGPVFSPDGRRMAFISQRFLNSAIMEIHTVRPDGTGLKLVTDAVNRVDYLSFSPDGRRLAFNQGSDIYSINLDGTGLKRLTATNSSTRPVYSPDGKTIAFVRYGDPDEPSNSDIWFMDADGGDTRQITSGPGEDWVDDWTRSAPFVFRKFNSRRSLAVVRVFGPGKLTVSGRHVTKAVKTTEGTRTVGLRVTPRANVRLKAGAQVKLKVRFAPKGGLPSTIEKTIRLGGR